MRQRSILWAREAFVAVVSFTSFAKQKEYTTQAIGFALEVQEYNIEEPFWNF